MSTNPSAHTVAEHTAFDHLNAPTTACVCIHLVPTSPQCPCDDLGADRSESPDWSQLRPWPSTVGLGHPKNTWATSVGGGARFWYVAVFFGSITWPGRVFCEALLCWGASVVSLRWGEGKGELGPPKCHGIPACSLGQYGKKAHLVSQIVCGAKCQNTRDSVQRHGAMYLDRAHDTCFEVHRARGLGTV